MYPEAPLDRPRPPQAESFSVDDLRGSVEEAGNAVEDTPVGEKW